METSELLKLRLENELPQKHISQVKESLIQKDFHKFAEVVMRESNQLHAICLDTLPAIFYMNNTSKLIVNTIRDLNTEYQQNIAAYSIDAGFHVFVFTLKEQNQLVKSRIETIAGQQLERIIETEIDRSGVVSE